MEGIITGHIFIKVKHLVPLHAVCCLADSHSYCEFVADLFGCLVVPCCCGPQPMSLLNHSDVSGCASEC